MSSKPNLISVHGSALNIGKPNEEFLSPKNKFLNMLNEKTNPVFYSYKNSKGQPVCSGYDNYIFNVSNTKSATSPRKPADQTMNLHAKLLNNSNGLRKNSNASQLGSPSLLRDSTNASALKLIFYKGDEPAIIRPTSQMAMPTHSGTILESRPSVSALPGARMSSSANVAQPASSRSYSEPLMARDDNKLFYDSFKTQAIRSLTFKQIVTY